MKKTDKLVRGDHATSFKEKLCVPWLGKILYNILLGGYDTVHKNP